MRKTCLHSYVIQKNRFTGLYLISSTGEQVELGLWFPTVLSDAVLDMYAATDLILRALLSQKSSNSSRRWEGVAPSLQPRNSSSDWGMLILEKLFVKAITLCFFAATPR